jgi:hypothetical protein
MDYDNLEIRVRNGTVGLYGHVVSRTNAQQAERAIRRVRGVAGIENHLVADDRLLAEVATGLGALDHGDGSKLYGCLTWGGDVERNSRRHKNQVTGRTICRP